MNSLDFAVCLKQDFLAEVKNEALVEGIVWGCVLVLSIPCSGWEHTISSAPNCKHTSSFKTQFKFTIKTQGLEPLSRIFTIYITDCPREIEGGKRMGEDSAAQIPFFWDAPKEANTPPGAAELWEQAQGPEPSLCPQRPSQLVLPGQELKDLWLCFFHDSRSCKFSETDMEGKC